MLSIAKVVEATLKAGAVRGTYFVSPSEVIRVTRRRYGKNTKKVRSSPVELTVTIGRPNYREREMIRTMQKAKEPFPVKKIRWEWPIKGVPPNGVPGGL